MNPNIERGLYLLVIFGLGGYVANAGAQQTRLERNIPYTAQQLLKDLSSKAVKPQVVDLRALSSDDDDDDVGGYEDAHIPGSLPMPACDETKMPATARDMLRNDVPTIIVTRDGDAAAYQRCADKFLRARNLAGGAAAWIDAGLPEEDGEHVPPSMGGGGGCL